MVDYRGPAATRWLVDRLGIPSFERVVKMHYSTNNIDIVQLNRNSIAKMSYLQQILVTHRKRTLTDPDVEHVLSEISPCRIASVVATGRRMDVSISQDIAALVALIKSVGQVAVG